jgi:hypothetical protein
MANTTNFNWETPDDTDLVKDGAAAIRTLGNSIDTSFVDLKGGTTGQILSKASNTDLDYTWIANDQGDVTEVQAGTGISVASGTGPIPVVTNTMATAVDAKGDLIVGTGADTFARLAVGTNGHTLVADSGETTGLKWAAPAAGANWTLLNAGGTALTGAATITISGISGKDKIMVLISEASSANSDAYVGVRLNAVTSSSYYGYGILNVGASTYAATNFATDTGAATYVPVAQTSGSAGGQVNGYVLFTGCNSSGVKVLQSVGGSNASGSSGHKQLMLGGYFNSSDLITSVSLFSASGNFDNGTVYVYTSA